MTKTFKKQSLTEPQKKKFQRRLHHYFKDHKYRTNLLSKEVAELLGYQPHKFSELESEWKPHSRFLNSLDFLAGLASLENMSVSEFVRYLEGKQDRYDDPDATDSKRKLQPWEKTVLEAIDPLSIGVRKDFVDFCKTSTTEGKEKLEVLVEILNVLKDKDKDALTNILEAFSSLKSK